MERVQTDRAANASIIWAMVGLLTFPFLVAPLLAVVMGRRAHRRMDPKVEQGQSLATAGVILGVVELLFGVGIWLYVSQL